MFASKPAAYTGQKTDLSFWLSVQKKIQKKTQRRTLEKGVENEWGLAVAKGPWEKRNPQREKSGRQRSVALASSKIIRLKYLKEDPHERGPGSNREKNELKEGDNDIRNSSARTGGRGIRGPLSFLKMSGI